jgi:hypothetical protein
MPPENGAQYEPYNLSVGYGAQNELCIISLSVLSRGRVSFLTRPTALSRERQPRLNGYR